MRVGGFSSLFSFGLRQLAQNQQDIQTSLERLATGKRVNHAKDDPSAIIPIEDHKAEIYSLNKKLESFGQQEGFLGAKEGGLSVISDLVNELHGFVVDAANTAGHSPEELDAIGIQVDSIIQGIDRIAQNTTFKGQSVLSEYTSANLGADLSDLSKIILKDPSKAQDIVEGVQDRVSKTRAAIGTSLKEIDSKRRVIGEKLENLNASLSSLQDTDYAAETAKLVRSQILESATIAAIDISRQSANQVLGLLEQSTKLVTPAG